MIELILLLGACHWMADFTQLSTKEMLAAKKFGYPYGPILAHAGVHGSLMFAVLVFYVGFFFGLKLALIVFVSHFLIDVAKGKVNKYIPSTQLPTSVYHWWVFGIGQYLHWAVIVIVAKLAIDHGI